MKTSQPIALLVAALLVVTVAACGVGDETVAAGVSTTAAPGTGVLQTTTTPTTTPDDGLAEEYEVYSALIQSVFVEVAQPPGATLGRATNAGRPPALIVIRDTTARPVEFEATPDAARFAHRQWPELGDDILSEFETKNEKPSSLERRFSLDADYVLISREELDSIFSKNPSGWTDFYAKFPHSQGILSLSRVAFNEAKDTALLYAGNQWHAAAGEGNMVLLKKTAAGWTVQGTAMMWVS